MKASCAWARLFPALTLRARRTCAARFLIFTMGTNKSPRRYPTRYTLGMKRDFVIIGIVAIAAIGVGVYLYSYGPESLALQVSQAFSSNASGSGPVQFMVLARGSNAVSVKDRANYRIQNAQDLSALWSLIYGVSDTPTPPTVNFSTSEVLAVFDGSDPTTGYTINIASVTDENGQRLVLVAHDSPGSSCIVQNTPTSPFEVIVVPKTSNSLSHQDQMGAMSCS